MTIPVGGRTISATGAGARKWILAIPSVKLLDFAVRRAELEASDNPFATVVLAHLDTQVTRHDQGERKDRKFRLIKKLFERGWSEKQIRELFRLIDWMMELPTALKNQFWEEVKRIQEEKHMPFVSTPQWVGRAEGRLEGIEAVLTVRFPATAEAILPEIRQIRDADQLDRILQAAKSVAELEDLRKLWAT